MKATRVWLSECRMKRLCDMRWGKKVNVNVNTNYAQHSGANRISFGETRESNTIFFDNSACENTRNSCTLALVRRRWRRRSLPLYRSHSLCFRKWEREKVSHKHKPIWKSHCILLSPRFIDFTWQSNAFVSAFSTRIFFYCSNSYGIYTASVPRMLCTRSSMHILCVFARFLFCSRFSTSSSGFNLSECIRTLCILVQCFPWLERLV